MLAIFRKKGFTLIELLIVVAIIGVLSTLGIPTFRKMVQKAKKSEAKVGLGGLYTAETAFFAEYGVYGSFLDKIGFELSGNGGMYTMGFPDSNCVDSGIMPTEAAVKNLKDVYPTYFSAIYSGIYLAAENKRPKACQAATRIDDGSTFKATATGAISPNAALSKITDLDTWTIDKDRKLTNENDGVK